MQRERLTAGLSLGFATATITASLWLSQAQAAGNDEALSIQRGRYIARVAGCNDCHTPGYGMSGGTVPESQWLVGDELGWKGPWGTTYPANLRIALGQLTEDQWVTLAHSAQFRPPMPWFALRDMSEDDLRALYRFVRSLGPAGKPAPAYVPPGQSPRGPVVTFPEPPAQKSASR